MGVSPGESRRLGSDSVAPPGLDRARPTDPPLRDAELELRRSEARFRLLIECAPEAIFVHRKGRFVYANPATGRLLGYPLSALEGKAISEILHPDELAGVVERTKQMLATGVPSAMGLHRFVRGDGSTAMGETVPLPIEFDGVPSVIVFARDVTERLRLEAALQQADRMASVGTLAAGVAHEINNPLAYVVSNLSQAVEQLPELSRELAQRGDAALAARLDELGRTLAEAREGADRVRSIVRDLKTLSRPDDEGAPARVDVTTALESSIHMARSAIHHRARLVRNYVADPAPIVKANASRLVQVFLNVLMNAAQAIPVGDAEANEIRVDVRVVENRVEVAIADTGPGIPSEILGRIFEPFFTTRTQGEGTGLGLSVCHGIVQSMGGEITVASEPGHGAMFRIVIPAALPSARPAPRMTTPPVATAAAEPPGRRRVLVVDDEAAIGRALTRLLARDGHEVTTVSSGREALARFDAGEGFDVVMCDLMMPELTGIELYERVRVARPELAQRFVFMTGGAFTAHAQDFLASVPNATVEKPFDSAQVRALMAKKS